jgi:hypothetical protein
LNPPQPVRMQGLQDGMLPPCAPFCAVDAPNVTVTMPYVSLPHAYETNLVEEDVRLLPCTAHSVTVHTKPFSLYTVRLGAGA